MKNDSPYKTQSGKCVHITDGSFYKSKKQCPYNNPSKCKMYNEWVELVNYTDLEEKSIVEPLNTSKNIIQEKTSGA